MSESNAALFLEKYREMEYCIRSKYHLDHFASAVAFLEKHAEFTEIEEDLKYCREVRNLLTHKPQVHKQYCVEPSYEMIELIEHVIETLEKPPVIMDIAVPVSKILYKDYSSNFIDTLKEMNERSFGNVPILQDGIVQGVLSEKAIVNFIVQEDQFHLSKELTLNDIKNYLSLENDRKEYYRFVKKDSLISEVSELFHDGINKGARIGMVFITKNGRKEEKLLGIVTAWDLAARKEK
ncbi:MAG: hypothetical protein Q4E53_12505 [Eubacteriales bacterium]|nr:hypothetical protein [Eubacteriales bacterium]